MNFDLATVFISSSILFLLLVILVVVFVLYYQKRLLMQKIKNQNMQTEFRMNLLQATIETQEKEQLRLARDLHDDVGPLLTGTQLQVRQVQRFVSNEAPEASALNLADEMLLKSIAAVRRVSHNLVPPTLERYGLTAALEGFINQFPTEDNPRMVLHSNLASTRLPGNMEMELYRMVQELINNTAKHAEASQVNISLRLITEGIQLNYDENGKGFDASKSSAGLGLKNLENRAALLQGNLKIDTAPGEGFHAEVTIPIHEKSTTHE